MKTKGNMIKVTKLNGKGMVVNADLVEKIESIPDTMLHLTNGRRIMVKETVTEIVRRLIEYNRNVTRSRTADGARLTTILARAVSSLVETARTPS